MHEPNRKVKSLNAATLRQRLKSDPLRSLELGIVFIGTVVSALSSFFAWQASSSSAQQAEYAREALTTAEANSTFRSYLSAWNKMCQAINPTEYLLDVSLPGYDRDGVFHITVDNRGFDRAAFDYQDYVRRVEGAERAAFDELLSYRTFSKNIEGLDGPESPTPYFYFLPRDLGYDVDRIERQLIKSYALCFYHLETQMLWYKDRTFRARPIIRLLNDVEIRYTRRLDPAPKPR